MLKLKNNIEKIQRDVINGKEILIKQEEELTKAKQILEEKNIKIKELQQEIDIEKTKEVKIEADPEQLDSRNPDKQQCIDELNHLKGLIAELQSEQAELQKTLSSQLKKK